MHTDTLSNYEFSLQYQYYREVHVLGYLGVPASLINLIWEIVGPLMISEAYLDDITQNDIDLANKMRDFYVKPYGIITSNNLGGLIDLATDALFQ